MNARTVFENSKDHTIISFFLGAMYYSSLEDLKGWFNQSREMAEWALGKYDNDSG